MWHAITPVSAEYDPILYESDLPTNLVLINVGPGKISGKAWREIPGLEQPDAQFAAPNIQMQLWPGEQRIIGGRLIRVHLISGEFAAVGWTVLFGEF